MLKLRYDTEDWRERLSFDIGDAECVVGVEHDVSVYNDLADDLCTATLQRLRDKGIEFERAHVQSVGAFVIVQVGPSDERLVFEEIVDHERCKMRDRILDRALSLKEQSEN